MTTSCPSVIRREHTADKGDDGQAELAAVTQCVNIPPEVATRWDRLIEARCAIVAAAASLPDIAAMGTPGPGCTLPPAKIKPGIEVAAFARLKADIHPCVACP